MDVSTSSGVGWELQTGSTDVRINTNDFVMSASGSANMSASGSSFTINCNNGIYLN
jgi:hypothetical protein